ncbi:Zn-dependent exopeptidase [Phellopilus nigrolimitatus]|nr:Zn-dependent exopeptidase [Phellopilus nigrolimitatus]
MSSSIRDRAASVLAFKKLPVTIVVVFIYAAIYISLSITDNLPSFPTPAGQHGLNLDDAYADLHKIAGLPHPYNSHQNDVVRKFILARVQSIAAVSPFVEVDDDRISNVTFGMAGSGVAAYFEGSNVLIKVDGTQPDLNALLFSAHFDSVSTAPGATDDGMGVATLISLVDYFSNNQPKRTLVFNINNGEEDGLYGAHAFLEHPWFNLTGNFINVEGAGAGGRPLLLRATATHHARAWSAVAHPHGLVASADAFARGVVKSATDYSVYTAAARGGIDFSFYRQRSKYHTKEDTIPSLGGKAALWNMMESTFLAGLALIEEDDKTAGEESTPVYFDLFGEAFAVLSLKTFYIINIVLLVVGPILVAVLVFVAQRKNKLYWSAKGWGRTPTALVIGGGLTVGLGILYRFVNPFIIYSSATAVLISTLTLSLLSFYAVLALFAFFLPVPQQRSTVLLESYIFWWILLVIDTVAIGRSQIGGLYFVTFFYAGTLVALLLGLLEHFELPSARRGSRNGNAAVIDNEYRSEGDDTAHEVSSERTPLLAQNGRGIKKSEIDEDNEIGLWFIQFLLAVPFPVILITQVGLLLVNALSQTLADGSSVTTVYIAVSFVSIISFVPLLPFIHKLHRFIPYTLVLVLVVTTTYNVFSFPFSENSPLKVFFQETINLDSDANFVQLSGVNPWLENSIVSELPSAWDNNRNCSTTDPLRANIPSCTWPGLPPHVAAGQPSSWLRVNATQTAPGAGLLSIAGVGSRSCRVYFDTPAGLARVRGSGGRVQAPFPLAKSGVDELRLWSRTWERTFEVSVAWEGGAPMSGRVACEWAEQTGIPALEEVVSFLPKWARVTKRTDGLLEVSKSFTLN